MKRIFLNSIVILSLCFLSFSYGYICHRYDLFPKNLLVSLAESFRKPWGVLDQNVIPKTEPVELFEFNGGFWIRRRDKMDSQATADWDALLSLPYVSGSRPVQPNCGVTIYDPTRAFKGFNLYSSAHGPEAFLTDMMGRVLHKWRFERDQIWPVLSNTDFHSTSRFFRRVHLF